MEATTQMDENRNQGSEVRSQNLESEHRTEEKPDLGTLHPEEQADDLRSKEEELILEPQTEEPSTLGAISNALRSDLKAQVEAVLFVSDTPVKTGAISKMLNASYDDVQSALVQLIQEYEDRNGGLEIGTDDGYVLQVKTQYLNIVTDMMPLELNPGPMRTLSAIALKEPVLQSEIIDMRGSGAYEHINELAEQDLITKKPQGLSYILRTTKKFQQYFRLTQEADKIKEKLQEEASKRTKEKKKLEEEIQNQEAEISSEQPVAG